MNKEAQGGPGALSLLGIAFVVLKLTDTIDWSWWWVLLPFFVGWVMIGVIGLIYLVLLGVAEVLDYFDKRRRQKKARKRREQQSLRR